MNKEEILYNEIYERTKDFGRTHFIKEIMRLQREIKELKDRIKTYEEPEDLTLMFMYCDEKVRDKMKELKKQLTTCQILYRDCKVENLKNISKIEEMENQQKEFIEFLEKMWEETQDIWFIKILNKYKEIIGGKE